MVSRRATIVCAGIVRIVADAVERCHDWFLFFLSVTEQGERQLAPLPERLGLGLKAVEMPFQRGPPEALVVGEKAGRTRAMSSRPRPASRRRRSIMAGPSSTSE